MKNQRRMTAYFTDGSNLKFSFPKQTNDPSNLSTMIKKAMNENQLIMEVEGGALYNPTGQHQVRSFQSLSRKIAGYGISQC